MGGFYQVVAECAHVTVDTPYGRMQQLLMKDARVSPDAPELKRLLDIGFVVKVGDDAEPVEDADTQQADAEKAKADAELEEKRAAARAKLPDGGAMPDGRTGQPVWVEYLVARGSRYEDVKDTDKDELIKLAKQQS